MTPWEHDEVGPVALAALGQRYRRYRLADAAAEEAMARSLRRFGQQTPLVACRRPHGLEVIDGFKRLTAAAQVSWTTVSVRVIEADERAVKAAIYGLNQVGRHLVEVEEAWLVQALVREDGLTQVDVAALLGRHKSWVCRRLALLEKVSPAVKAELGLGLVSPTTARQLLRLPTGNQAAVLAATRRDSLTAAEVSGVVDLLLACQSSEQEDYVLTQPRQALAQRQGGGPRAWDPRLSPAGNCLARQLAQALDQLERLEHWLLHRGTLPLPAADRPLLAADFRRLLRDTLVVSELTTDLLQEYPS
jgi:ParB/RepB/Spo0J family partition protein